jgi:hypothetical protein
VRGSCLGFCDISNILEGTAGKNPSDCEADFKEIVRCMADGRNHVPCCDEANIPRICQERDSPNNYQDYIRTRLLSN